MKIYSFIANLLPEVFLLTFKISFYISQYFYNHFNTKNHSNMQSNHQYYFKTKKGLIELSKGAYLTIMKRQKSSVKTLKKTKKITHQLENIKNVIKCHKINQAIGSNVID